ncbi:hypothetical protein WISP_91538 [Willisornis vidua]|uniref:Uncharacterized protein n=1 Tax=Willisornis vidua TaxID=1566151 RepID=A0ABQ9D708_9PASS|nr:hypothetical protein WISP_91538 [Willisornis vidua]
MDWLLAKAKFVNDGGGTSEIMLPDQEENMDEAFYRQLETASKSQGLLLEEQKQSREFLRSLEDNFVLQVAQDSTRNGVLLTFILTHMEGLVGDVKVGGSLGCSDHETVEFSIRLWRSGDMLDWKKASVTLVFKKGKKEDAENYQPVSLTSFPRKLMECLSLEAISTHMDGKENVKGEIPPKVNSPACRMKTGGLPKNPDVNTAQISGHSEMFE